VDCDFTPGSPSCYDPCQDGVFAGEGFVGMPMPWCGYGGGGTDPAAITGPAGSPTCEDQEIVFITAYLSRVSPNSPLISYTQTIVQVSDAAGIDDRFLIALAGQESTYGTNITKGPYNAWNNLAHTAKHNPYANWTAAINGVANLVTGKLYFGSGKTTIRSIYGTYDNSNLQQNPNYPKDLSGLTQIYKQLVGPTASANSAVNFSRCPQ
jgi:hypothetical protein